MTTFLAPLHIHHIACSFPGPEGRINTTYPSHDPLHYHLRLHSLHPGSCLKSRRGIPLLEQRHLQFSPRWDTVEAKEVALAVFSSLFSGPGAAPDTNFASKGLECHVCGEERGLFLYYFGRRPQNENGV
ncbi:hypothetical protein WG66_004440 [Moniliophthora roreri]|nr:hypothetical protein WG66_004440 [Moniliophthora roreri]KAI3603889.1 hypothetical protein WG66_004440 [Moniliophthora roreri]